MSIWKILSGILSILLCGYAVFQAILEKGLNIISLEGGIPGSANLIAAALLLVGGIVAIATRDSFSNIGNAVLILLYGAGAAVGYLFAGIYSELLIGATWCVLCAVMAAVAIAADNICDIWVYILIFVIGVGFAAAGILINLHGETLPDFFSKDRKTVQDHAEDIPLSSGQSDTSGPDEAVQSGPASNTGSMPASGDVGDYHVEIKGAALAKDKEGSPVIIVTYAWTNNSGQTTSATVSTEEKAFQNGTELEHVFSIDRDAYAYDPSGNSTNIRPGEAVDVQCAFALTSNTAAVTFQITEWMGSSGDMVSTEFDLAKT